MSLLHLHQVKVQIRTLHIMTYQVMRMSQYQQNKTKQLMQIFTLPNMLNDNIENQMNAPTQEMVNDDGELIYE